MRHFGSAAELSAAAGENLGASAWHTVTQAQIDTFARATGDEQWIHVDAERARNGPFGTTVAHGYLTLSLLPVLTREIFTVDGARMVINYGLNRVRFPAPLRSGSEVRAQISLAAVDASPERVQLVSRATISARGEEKPCCVAETVTLVYF